MPISLGELATRFGCDLDGDPDIEVDHVAGLTNAGPASLTFLESASLRKQLPETRAAAVILRAEDARDCPVAALVTDDPYAAYARMAALLHPAPDVIPGVHAAASVDAGATVADSAQIDALAYVGKGAVIGERVYVGPGSVVGSGCVIGDDCRLIANVSLPRAVTIGQRGLFHPGVVIGGDGFGNAMTSDGWVKIPQTGGVQIGDDVELGANTTVDCGAIGDTIVEEGVRIDNLCMIAHNVVVGAHTAMASAVAIAGSAKIGKRCLFGGQSGSVGHVTICDDVVINGRGMVTKSISEPGVYASGFPSEKLRDWNRKVASFRRIDVLKERVRKLERGR